MSCLSWQVAALALWGFVSEGGMAMPMRKNSRGAVVSALMKCFEGSS